MPQKKDRTKDKFIFLEALAKGLTVSKAAALTETGKRTFYDMRDQEPGFAEAWRFAQEDFQERTLSDAEKELRERAFDRNDKYSHILLIFLLKRLDPHYKENYKSEQKVTFEHIKEYDFSPAEIESAADILKNAKRPSGDEVNP